jgi:hypothetical protein
MRIVNKITITRYRRVLLYLVQISDIINSQVTGTKRYQKRRCSF